MPQHDHGPEVLVACDGSCLVNPGGPTGWAWVASNGRWASGCQAAGTNQVAELWGVLSVLRDFPVEPLAIQIDSVYAMKIATTWAHRWARNGWRNRDGKAVSNLTLVQSVHRQMVVREAPVRFIKVPGHDRANRFPLNTAADLRARAAAVYAKEHARSEEFTGHDPSAVLEVPRSPQPSTNQPVQASAAPVMCMSCDRPINANAECGCSA